MNTKSPTATTTSTEGKRFAPTKVKPGGLNNQSVKPGQQGAARTSRLTKPAQAPLLHEANKVSGPIWPVFDVGREPALSRLNRRFELL